MAESTRQPIDERHDLMAAGNRKTSSRTEIVLNVD